MGKLKRFEDMEVWKSARVLAKGIYEISRNPLLSKDYELRDQMRRAAISIISNIAEGAESQTNSSFCRYLYSARASAAEVRAQLCVALDLKYISETEFAALASQARSISRQVTGFIGYLQKSAHPRKSGALSGIGNLESGIG